MREFFHDWFNNARHRQEEKIMEMLSKSQELRVSVVCSSCGMAALDEKAVFKRNKLVNHGDISVFPLTHSEMTGHTGYMVILPTSPTSINGAIYANINTEYAEGKWFYEVLPS